MAKKFIINQDRIVLSASVTYHEELAKDHLTTKGGGYWFVNDELKRLYLYGQSVDFGACTLEDLRTAIPKSYISVHWVGYEVYFSYNSSLANAIKDAVLIGKL